MIFDRAFIMVSGAIGLALGGFTGLLLAHLSPKIYTSSMILRAENEDPPPAIPAIVADLIVTNNQFDIQWNVSRKEAVERVIQSYRASKGPEPRTWTIYIDARFSSDAQIIAHELADVLLSGAPPDVLSDVRRWNHSIQSIENRIQSLKQQLDAQTVSGKLSDQDRIRVEIKGWHTEIERLVKLRDGALSQNTLNLPKAHAMIKPPEEATAPSSNNMQRLKISGALTGMLLGLLFGLLSSKKSRRSPTDSKTEE